MNFNRRVAFYTLGCKVNQYETESIKNQLIQRGYKEVDFEDVSDIYIVNSCTVTSIADKKTRNMLRRAKKSNPDSTVIITGCYAQTNSKEILEMDCVDFVIGNKDKSSIVNFINSIEEINSEREKNSNIFEEKEYKEYEFATLREMTRAYVKIQDGCNLFCTYCKIPFARGRSRSRKKENVLKEIEKLVEDGFKEVILIGINLSDYGKDFKDENINFETLVSEILKIQNLERVRIGSVYPDKISDEFISLFHNKKLVPHLHISLQSCDDYILKRMHRHYGASLIEERLLKLKNEIPNMEYTADVIVGFPGESHEMFMNTYNIIEKISFSNLHIFPYSDREGTLASKMTDKIEGSIKKERVSILEKLKNKMYKKNREKYLSKNLEVLVEEEKEDGFYGYSENYLRVKITKEACKINEIKKININDFDGEILKD